jgi:two-component system sensor histidine kinase KdpD
MLSDSKLLNTALHNVLHNAINYSPEDRDIIIEVTNSSKQILIGIQDFGNGISDDVIDRIFHSFVRSQDFTNISGSGLGLSIAKYCTDQLRGKI